MKVVKENFCREFIQMKDFILVIIGFVNKILEILFLFLLIAIVAFFYQNLIVTKLIELNDQHIYLDRRRKGLHKIFYLNFFYYYLHPGRLEVKCSVIVEI